MPASWFFCPVPESEELYVKVLPVLFCQATLQVLRSVASKDDPPACIDTPAANALWAAKAPTATAAIAILIVFETFMKFLSRTVRVGGS